MEIGLTLRGNVYYRLVNWEGIWDHVKKFLTPGIEKVKTSTITKNTTKSDSPERTNSVSIAPKFVGKYNATELRALFGGDVQVTTSSYNETRPSITRTSDGTLWITYDYAYSATDHDIYVANSTDGGSTWNVYFLDASTANTSNPVILSDSLDNVYIFFENHTSGAYFEYLEYESSTNEWMYVYISTWTWWGSVTNLSAATYTYGTDIYIYVVFEYIYSSTDHDVGYAKTVDGGSTWYEDHDSSTSIAYTGSWEGHPSVSISTGTNPKVFVAYDVFDGNYWNVTVKNNTGINGTSWNGEVFYLNGYNLYHPSVYATGDDAYVAFELEVSSTDHDIGIFNTTDNGVSWKWASWAASTTEDERYPMVVAYGADVYLLYLNVTSGYICEIYSADYGQTWSNVNLVSDLGSGVAIYRTVYAYYYDGKVYVAWTDNRNGNYDIYFDSATVPEFNPTILIFLLVVLALISTRRKNLSMLRHARHGEKNVRSIQVQQKRERN
ncbi:MAG: hypothetical protein GXO25_04090 [Euryarchaeota archaeon]|nr:hypothetical protein [Euryarchaeota archaeon]